MKSIESEQQFLMYLKTKDIDLKDFDYTTDDQSKMNDPEYRYNHPYKKLGKRYYENPFLWKWIFDHDYAIAIDYMKSFMNQYLNLDIILAIISSSTNDNILLDILHIYIDNNKGNGLDYDKIIHTITITNRNKALYYIMDYLNNHKNIKPKYGTWGNGSNGLTFIEAIKIGNKKILDLLIDNGSIDISSDDGWCYIMALKYGRYDIAKKIIDKNKKIDIHMKNDLGLKMIQRNDKNKNVIPIGIMKDCREYLLSLY